MSVIRSIRLRATLLICGFILAVTVVYATAAYQEMKDSAVTAARGRLANVSAEIAEMIRMSTQRITTDVVGMAEDSAVIRLLQDPSSTKRYALEALRPSPVPGLDDPDVVGTVLRDVSGREVLRTRSALPGETDAFDPAIARVLAEADSAVITPLRVVEDSLLYAAVARVESEGEQPIGYVVRWRRLVSSPGTLDFISRLIGADGRLYLANTRGDLWTDLARQIPNRPTNLEQFAGAAIGELPSGSKVLLASTPVPGAPWTVLVELPLDQVLAESRAVMSRMAIFGLLLLIAGAVSAWIVSGRMTRSIVELANAAEAIRAGDYSRRTSIQRDDELGTLGRGFNTMAESVEHARHELEGKVAELAASEVEQREMRARMEQVITSSRAILYQYRGTAPVELDWVSDNVERQLGYTVEELRSRGWWDGVLHPDDRPAVREMLARLYRRGQATQEYRLRHADGSYLWVRDERRLLNGGAETAEVVGVLLDITEHRDLRVAKEAAELANRAKSEFLSRMSHELRTPLNAILGFGQILELDVARVEDRESVTQILKAGEHLLALINEVLDIARIEAGKMSLSVEPVAAGAVLRESVDLVRLMAAKHEIRLRAEGALASKHYVRADQQRLKQVLLNLLSNAIKYNRRGGAVRLWTEEVEGRRLRLTVEDTGYGIAPEKQARLFTPFDRLGAEQSGVEGTGLGLALSKGLVEAMGGTMGVDSILDEGSRFWIEIPLAAAPAAALPAPEPGAEAERAGAGERPEQTVLFVEDNLANVRLMERVFQRRPHVRLITAMQGSLGLELAREHRPDLILLDLNLPDQSGEEVLRQLQHDPALRNTPVIMVSGDAIPAKIGRVLDLGAHDYVTKPFNVQELLQRIDHHLEVERRSA